MSRGIRRGICCRCLPDACSASPIKLGEMRKTKLYQSCHASRPRSCHRSHRRRGITSACAEQTPDCPTVPRAGWDHLRVCGADKVHDRFIRHVRGSPPRVRSRRIRPGRKGGGPGITSACAEQTSGRTCQFPATGDHLRVCGADSSIGADVGPLDGSPPRVRSRRYRGGVRLGGQGITSACAEQTRAPVTSSVYSGDHLRVCGADR